MERTRVLQLAVGVLLVREGDDVLEDYRVGRIEARPSNSSSSATAPRLRAETRTHH